MKLPLLFDTCRYLQVEYFFSTTEDDAHNCPIVMPIRITAVEQVLALIIGVAGVIARETEDIASVSLDPVKLKFQVDRPAVVIDFHNIDDRLSISPIDVIGIP